MSKDDDMTDSIIALDADGVLLDLNEAWRAQACDILNRPVSLRHQAFEMTRRYGISAKEEELVWQSFHWSDFPTIDGAAEGVEQLHALGREIHVITAIAREHRDLRLDNLSHLNIPAENIHCTGFNQSKSHVLQTLRAHVYVDDRPEYVLESIQTGVGHTLYFDHQYDDIRPDIHPDANTVNSWHELIGYIQGL